METLVSEVVKSVGQDTNRLEFSTHSTFSEDNYVVFKVNQNHNIPIMIPGLNHTAIKYHWFIEKIYSGECYVKKVDGKDQKANIFTRDIKGEILLHIIKLFCGWQIKVVE